MLKLLNKNLLLENIQSEIDVNFLTIKIKNITVVFELKNDKLLLSHIIKSDIVCPCKPDLYLPKNKEKECIIKIYHIFNNSSNMKKIQENIYELFS